MDRKTTSTFTIHHDKCDPASWTPKQVLLLADYLRTSQLTYAAALARLGMQLVLDERHEPKGGVLEEIGFAAPDNLECISEDLREINDDGDDVFPVVRMYRGPVEWVAQYGVGDEEGNLEGYEHEIMATEEEARAYVAALQDDDNHPRGLSADTSVDTREGESG